MKEGERLKVCKQLAKLLYVEIIDKSEDGKECYTMPHRGKCWFTILDLQYELLRLLQYTKEKWLNVNEQKPPNKTFVIATNGNSRQIDVWGDIYDKPFLRKLQWNWLNDTFTQWAPLPELENKTLDK